MGNILSLTFVRWVVLKQDQCCCLNPFGVFGLWGPLLGASVSRVYCPNPSVGILLFSLAASSALDSG